MAESNATQVILTDDGIKIIKAQDTADNAASQASKADSAALIAQSIANAAKKAADITYNYANSEIAVQSTATAKAQSKADDAFSKATAVGDKASAEILVQSTATAKAQSKADNAFSKATTAIDNGQVTSQAVTDLKDGSKLTITELENGLATKVANSDYASYKIHTASQIAQKVDNGAFSAYQQTTADLIAQKVATKDFSAYQATTAKSIDSKVESKEFNTYKSQTADTISQKVATKDFSAYQDTTAKAISNKVESKDFNTYKTQTADLIAEKVANKDFSTYKTQTADLIAQKVATKDFSAYQATTAKSIDSKVESKEFNTYKSQTSDAISSKVSSVDFNNLTISNRNLALGTATAFKMTGNGSENNVGYMYHLSRTIAKGTTLTVAFDITTQNPTGNYTVQFAGGLWQGSDQYLMTSGTQHHSYTLVTNDDYSDVVQLRLDNSTAAVTVSNFIISESSKEVSWTPAPEDQATQSQITQLSDDMNLRVTKGDLIDEINLKAGNTLISSSGQLTLAADTIYFDTKKPVIIPNANIADTLNGKTFHGGDIISNANNTAKYYPMTITPDGAYKSTYFDSAVGLQSSVESGAISYKYRSMIGSGTYSYDNVAINGQGITLDSGTTTTKDTTFSAPETETAYISLTTEAGLYLHGSNANIDFGGHLSDDSTSVGMYMNPYGNLIAKSASHYWQISVAGTDNTGGGPVARFGIDRSNAYNIEFNRELDIGNFHINTGHTFTSWDKGAIHFAKGGGGAADIYAGAVNYTSLVKSSLLSVKRDIQKADTAYWAQLVNSIDLATYQYKTDDNTSHIRLSSIVDDVNDTKQWQLPDVFISRDENGKLSGVDDSVLLNATLATVQEQQKQIDQLNGHNMELEARLNKLEAKLNG
ncbi:phage tail protein [Lactiplantibacillus paraplantarum]|uniref:phage tail protein n=1 Tax=Lactiplantibacillus paraplantarum TaxID=60520 RepID=UPI003B27FA7E